MKLGIDIDDTLVDLAKSCVKFLNDKLGKNFTKKDLDGKFIQNLYEISDEEYFNYLDEHERDGHLANLEPLEGAVEGIKKLLENHKLKLVTARPEKTKKSTLENISKHFDGLDEDIIFLNMRKNKIDKGETCIAEDIEVIVEDNARNCLDCAEKGVRSILIDQPWNQNIEHEKITRVYSWAEVLEKIKKIGEEKNA